MVNQIKRVMKELSIEEKAKVYDEAIKIAKETYNTQPIYKEWLERMFPQLKELEDEKIRKELIQYLEDCPNLPNGQYSRADFFTWLKKQGGQKPDIEMKTPEESLGVDSDTYNKIVDECIYGEPKFKVGNWYQCTKDFFGKGVTFDKNTAYYCAKEGCLQNEYGCHIAIVEDLYNNFKLWTIKDARDGDVLVYDGEIFMIKSYTLWNKIVYYCCYDGKILHKHSIYGSWRREDFDKVHPATKEQRELLFQKMEEAGYEWDEEKKESKKIGQKSAWSREDEQNLNAVQSLCRWLKDVIHVKYDKPVWGEEDIKAFNRICAILVDASEVKNWWKEYRLIEREEMIRLTDFLKSLHQQPHWKPSEEQIDALKEAMYQLDCTKYSDGIDLLYNDLKKL